MRGNCDNKEEDSNRAHLFPKVLGYMRESDIIEGDITKVKVHYYHGKNTTYYISTMVPIQMNKQSYKFL